MIPLERVSVSVLDDIWLIDGHCSCYSAVRNLSHEWCEHQHLSLVPRALTEEEYRAGMGMVDQWLLEVLGQRRSNPSLLSRLYVLGSDDVLKQLAARRCEATHAGLFVHCAGASEGVWKTVAENAVSFELIRTLFERKDTVARAAVRRLLRFEKIGHDLLREVLNRGEGWIERSDLAPLLASGDTELRALAFRALGRGGTSDGSVER